MTEYQRRLANPPTADDGIFVGPGWIRVGKNVDEPLKDRQRRESAEKEVLPMPGAVMFWLAMACIGFAAWIFSILYKGLQ